MSPFDPIRVLRPLVCWLGALALAASADATNMGVNSALDNNVRDSVLTLREAILYSKGALFGLTPQEQAQVSSGPSGPHQIRFDLAAGTVIAIGSSGAGALPVISVPVVIDGGGVVLNGAAAGSVNGLWITAGGSTVRRLVIQGFTGGGGILLQDRGGNLIEGNFIGTDAAGQTAVSNQVGVWISRSPGNHIGGFVADPSAGCQSPCNLISANSAGVLIQDPASADNVIEGNFFGTDVTGTSPISNTQSITISNAPRNRIGLPRAEPFRFPSNLVAGTATWGITVEGVSATGNLIQGNFVGTDVTGSRAVGRLVQAISVFSSDNLIGGSQEGEGNLVSGNQWGVGLAGPASQRNRIEGNRIGTTADGRGSIPNDIGIFLASLQGVSGYPQNATVGAAANPPFERCTGACNLISGNDVGIVIGGSESTPDEGHRILGNFIGTDPEGLNAVGNRKGVEVQAPGCQIGGSAPGEGNLVSGNRETGIGLSTAGAHGNRIEGNRIGTRADGQVALANGLGGVAITSSGFSGVPQDNMVGGVAPGARNLISGNSGNGITLAGRSQRVIGNWIGLAADGVTPLGNGANGISATGLEHRIGGPSAPEGNVIAWNGGPGVTVLGTGRSAIRANEIHDNAGLGIDLGGDGPTRNDETDGDVGPNNLRNTPLSVFAEFDGTNTRITAILHPSDGSESIDFYASTAGDPSGFGEGETFLGTGTPIGNETFLLVVPGTLASRKLSATATDGTGSTSEFAPLKNPLLFVPGMAASRLVNHSNGEELWLGAIPPVNHMRLSLFPKDHPNRELPDIRPGDVVRYAGPFPQYAPLLELLAGPAGYHEYQRSSVGCNLNQGSLPPTLWVYAYDWRHSNAGSVERLREQIDCIHQFYPGARVDLVTHSMGGLQARRYILEHPQDHSLGRMITIAAPFLGSLKAVNVLETGEFGTCFFGICIQPVLPSTLQELAKSFAGVHELLPSRAFFDLMDPSRHGFSEDGWDFDGNGVKFEHYGYDQFKRAMDRAYGTVDATVLPPARFFPGYNGDAFHSIAGQDDWRADSTDVSYHHIFAIQSGETAIGRIRAVPEVVCIPDDLRPECFTVRSFDLDMTVGDATVPRWSAARRGNHADLNKNDRVYGFEPPPGLLFGYKNKLTEHTTMLGNPEIQQTILSILEQGCAPTTTHMLPPLPSSAASCPPFAVPRRTALTGEPQVSEPAVEPYHTLRLVGVAHPVLRDDEGNTTAPWPGTTLAGQVPGAQLFEVGPEVWQAAIPGAGSFEVRFTAPAGPFRLTVIFGTSELTTHAVRFVDLVLPAGVAAVLTLASGGAVALRYDEDGDGIFETEVTPTVDVTGEAAQDREPPVIDIAMEPTSGGVLVTVAAADAGSGVERVLYSLDGSQYQPYLAPVLVDPAEAPVFRVLADDGVANRRNIEEDLPRTDLAVALSIPTGEPGPVAVGGELTYALRVENQGAQEATGAAAHLLLPAGVTVLSCGSTAGRICTNSDRDWRIDLGALAPGASREATVMVRIDCAAVEHLPLVARATAGSLLYDPNPANDTAEVTTQVLDPRSIAPSSESFPADGGPGTILISAPDGCPWSAASEAAFVTVTSVAAGEGSGEISYQVEPNPGEARQGSLRVAGRSFTVLQEGLDPQEPGGADFYTLAPCRIFDTRLPVGPHGGPALGGGTERRFPIAAACGVPPDAVAVSVNVTAVNATAPGFLSLYPALPRPNTSTLNVQAGKTGANNAILRLADDGSLLAFAGLPAGQEVHLILDVSGYFK